MSSESPANRSRVVVTRPVPGRALEMLEAHHDVDVLPEDAARDRAVLLGRVEGADAILTLITEQIDAELLDRAQGVRVVANMAVGYDNIDVDAATERNVLITNTPGVLTDTTADLAVALLLATMRRVVEADRFLRDGRWDRWGPLLLAGPEVTGSTVGVVGMGRIGEAFARRCALGFGMDVLYWSRSERAGLDFPAKRCATLEELLGRADAVSVHVPLDASTTHLIGARELALMRPGAVLINTARGPVVDEAALVGALDDGQLWSAGLDVFEREPEVHEGLFRHERVVLLPHIGSASISTRERMAEMAAENIVEVLAGRPAPSAVNG